MIVAGGVSTDLCLYWVENGVAGRVEHVPLVNWVTRLQKKGNLVAVNKGEVFELYSLEPSVCLFQVQML